MERNQRSYNYCIVCRYRYRELTAPPCADCQPVFTDEHTYTMSRFAAMEQAADPLAEVPDIMHYVEEPRS